MSETDAFGRDRDDDPLADMGWSSAANTATETETGGTAERTAGASPLPYRIPSYGPSPGRRRAPLRWVRRLVVLGVVVGIGAVVYAAAAPLIGDVVDEVEQALEPTEITGGGSTGSAQRPAPDVAPPVGLQRRSLILRGNLAPALRQLRRRAGGTIRTLRIAPDRIDVIVVTREGRMRSFQRRFSGELQMLSDTSAPGLQRAPAVRWSQVNASAPRRIARRMLAGGRSSRELDYLVLLNAAGVRWSSFRTDGVHFTASPDGRTVSRVGG